MHPDWRMFYAGTVGFTVGFVLLGAGWSLMSTAVASSPRWGRFARRLDEADRIGAWQWRGIALLGGFVVAAAGVAAGFYSVVEAAVALTVGPR